MPETDHWRQAQQLFEKMADLPADEQDAALSRECGRDAALLEQVSRLLKHDRAAAGEFLRPLAPPELPLPDLAQAPDLNLPAGSVLGGFRIERLIASGGMGSVYAAWQERPGRTVALKVFNRPSSSREALRRFQFEAEILGRLRHPNIAQIYASGVDEPSLPVATGETAATGQTVAVGVPLSAGLPSGRPGGGEFTRAGPVAWFTMEYIPEARNIVESAAEKRLSVEQRLELFAKVCDAIHHAHQRGVIHRDLKPANILVEGDIVSPGGSGVPPGAAGGPPDGACVSDDTSVSPGGTGISGATRGVSPSGMGISGATGVSPSGAGISGAAGVSPVTPEPKVIDFGVARMTASDGPAMTQCTTAGAIIGTLQYMSPEQCDGGIKSEHEPRASTSRAPNGAPNGAQPHGAQPPSAVTRPPNGAQAPSAATRPLDIDIRTDVYSLGVVLYELLTGRLPYDASGTIYRATRVIKETPPAPFVSSSLRRSVSRTLQTIVFKCLEKDRDRRYASAADLARDIRHFLAGEPIEARPPTAWTKSLRWAAQHPLLTTAAACLMVGLLTIISTMGLWLWLIYLRPHKLEILQNRIPSDRHGEIARLLTLSGHEIVSWKSHKPSGIAFGMMRHRPAEFGGGDVILLGFGTGLYSDYPSQIALFDVPGNYERPIWADKVEQAELIPDVIRRGRPAEQFAPADAWVEDVFEESPGEELMVVFGHDTYSQRAFRIYDFSGEVLYEIWHDGSMGDSYWMSGARLLVFSGDNCEGYWHDRGIQVPLGVRETPMVVFAVRPRFKYINRTDYRAKPARRLIPSTRHGTWQSIPKTVFALSPAEALSSSCSLPALLIRQATSR